ncbi:MAG: radical SAM protein [Candidatus Lokiarchaeota archaeon]|nr:radical SAM protein [Candidatus Lokiarchaeota archaeon]
MGYEIKTINKDSAIPIFGLDFIGIIDRGTNIIEIKPITLCNLKCKYCFVKCGGYFSNFIVDPNFLLEKVRDLVEFKGKNNIEVHIAPYGEILLYKDLFFLLESLWQIEGITTISMQTNGLLLNQEIIQKLERSRLTRINISLNTFNKKLAEYLTASKDYNIEFLLENFNSILKSKINLLIAPVWFPSQNDLDIEEIIKYVVNLRDNGYSKKKIQIGIQKYLVYKTGRKLKKIQPKTWGYFYKQLSYLEKKYDIKLKLGPRDFGIHKRKLFKLEFKEGDIIPIEIMSKGRWNNEYIGKINEEFSTKILINKALDFSEDYIGKNINVKILKSSPNDNIITTFAPF